ncbi:MAG: hypothetical protein ACF8NJ_03175 [Phycisphaerales bacterium JB038]
MAKRRRGPTLLEVLPHDMRRPSDRRTGYPVSAPPPVSAGDDERLEMGTPFGWLSPGQVVRLPVGYILIVAAGVVILAVAAFYIGFDLGDRAGMRKAQELNRTYGPTTIDPLVDDYIDPVGAAATPGGADGGTVGDPSREDEPTTAADAEDGAAETSSPAEPAPVGTTLERVEGLNYWILTSYLTPAEGERLIAFLGEHGVPARAYENPGTEFVQVWALRGFTREELRSPAAPAFEQQLRRLGRLWKNERGGTDDLATMYKKKY